MLGLEKAISEVCIGSTGPCGNKKKAEIFNFPQINVRLQVILGGGRLIGPAGTRRASPEMENRFSFTRHQSLQPEAAGPSQLTACLSVHLFLCCLIVCLLFFHPSAVSLCAEYVCGASEKRFDCVE